MATPKRAPHPNAEVLRAIAEGLPVQFNRTRAIGSNQWTTYEPKAGDEQPCPASAAEGFTWRIKPQTFVLDGVEYERPDAPKSMYCLSILVGGIKRTVGFSTTLHRNMVADAIVSSLGAEPFTKNAPAEDDF